MRRHSWLGVLAGAGLAAGCAGQSLDPVPIVAAGDFVCDGVPREGVELILGGPVTKIERRNRWDDESFLCFVGGAGAHVSISASPTMFATWGGGTDEGVLAEVNESEDAVPFDVESAGGSGMRLPTGALWVCDGRLVRVDLTGDLVGERDWSIDAANLLTSMLPWACNGEDAPLTTVEAG